MLPKFKLSFNMQYYSYYIIFNINILNFINIYILIKFFLNENEEKLFVFNFLRNLLDSLLKLIKNLLIQYKLNVLC